MAKSLIQQVKELPTVKPANWLDALTEVQRKEVHELIDGWSAGQWRDKLPFKASLAHFIKSRVGVNRSSYALVRYITERIANGNTR
jgi:hypothetical protein